MRWFSRAAAAGRRDQPDSGGAKRYRNRGMAVGIAAPDGTVKAGRLSGRGISRWCGLTGALKHPEGAGSVRANRRGGNGGLGHGTLLVIG